MNILIYLNRDDYAYKQLLSCRQLYELKEDLRITHLLEKEDSLLISISGLPSGSKWKVECYQDLIAYESSYPALKLIPGNRLYTLENLYLPIPRIKLGIRYTPSEDYKKNARVRESVAELHFSSIPVGNYNTYALKDWQRGAPGSESEIIAAKRLIALHCPSIADDSTLTRAKRTAAFLLQSLDTCRGIPGDTMNAASPFQRYTLALQGVSKVWCGDFSAILSFFLQVQGIVSREVCLEGKVDDVFLAGHSLNEVYLPELKKWILVDLTAATLCISHEGKNLNLLDLYELHKHASNNLRAVTLRNDSAVTVDYRTIKSFYDYFFKNSPKFVYYLNTQYQPSVYSFSSKFERYFFRNPTSAIYAGTTEGNNLQFYKKQGAALALLAFSIYMLFSALILLFTKRPPLS